MKNSKLVKDDVSKLVYMGIFNNGAIKKYGLNSKHNAVYVLKELTTWILNGTMKSKLYKDSNLKYFWFQLKYFSEIWCMSPKTLRSAFTILQEKKIIWPDYVKQTRSFNIVINPIILHELYDLEHLALSRPRDNDEHLSIKETEIEFDKYFGYKDFDEKVFLNMSNFKSLSEDKKQVRSKLNKKKSIPNEETIDVQPEPKKVREGKDMEFRHLTDEERTKLEKEMEQDVIKINEREKKKKKEKEALEIYAAMDERARERFNKRHGIT
jgi:hypothetical protein